MPERPTSSWEPGGGSFAADKQVARDKYVRRGGKARPDAQQRKKTLRRKPKPTARNQLSADREKRLKAYRPYYG